MLEQIFRSPWIITEHREGPLGKHSDAFAKWLMAAGYTRPDLRRRLGVVSDLNRWLRARKLDLSDLTPRRIAAFFHYRTKKVKSFYGGGSHATLQQLFSLLRAAGAIPEEPQRISRRCRIISQFLEGFVSELRDERGFSEAALKRYELCVRHFLVWRFGTRRIVLRSITLTDIVDFISHYRSRYSAKNVQLAASVLRAYFRFLFSNGALPTDFSRAIPSIPCWRGKRLPAFLERNDVVRLLRSCDRRTNVGRRNYAMLLIMLRLGLRASEVINLTLEDIQWERGVLTVQGKGQRRAVLPLPEDVGCALVQYVRHARPTCASRKLFVRTRAPYDQLHGASSVGTVVRRALIAAGLRPAQMGSHLLRYTAATESLRRGASLPEVRDLLRHRSIDTTAIYAKVDLRRLAELVRPWPAA